MAQGVLSGFGVRVSGVDRVVFRVVFLPGSFSGSFSGNFSDIVSGSFSNIISGSVSGSTFLLPMKWRRAFFRASK